MAGAAGWSSNAQTWMEFQWAFSTWGSHLHLGIASWVPGFEETLSFFYTAVVLVSLNRRENGPLCHGSVWLNIETSNVSAHKSWEMRSRVLWVCLTRSQFHKFLEMKWRIVFLRHGMKTDDGDMLAYAIHTLTRHIFLGNTSLVSSDGFSHVSTNILFPCHLSMRSIKIDALAYSCGLLVCMGGRTSANHIMCGRSEIHEEESFWGELFELGPDHKWCLSKSPIFPEIATVNKDAGEN